MNATVYYERYKDYSMSLILQMKITRMKIMEKCGMITVKYEKIYFGMG